MLLWHFTIAFESSHDLPCSWKGVTLTVAGEHVLRELVALGCMSSQTQRPHKQYQGKCSNKMRSTTSDLERRFNSVSLQQSIKKPRGAVSKVAIQHKPYLVTIFLSDSLTPHHASSPKKLEENQTIENLVRCLNHHGVGKIVCPKIL